MTTRKMVSVDRAILIFVILATLASPPYNDFHYWFHGGCFFLILIAMGIDGVFNLPGETGFELTAFAIFCWFGGNVLFWLYALENVNTPAS